MKFIRIIKAEEQDIQNYYNNKTGTVYINKTKTNKGINFKFKPSYDIPDTLELDYSNMNEKDIFITIEHCTKDHMKDIWGSIEKKALNKYLVTVSYNNEKKIERLFNDLQSAKNFALKLVKKFDASVNLFILFLNNNNLSNF